jgi:hypothetical protein
MESLLVAKAVDNPHPDLFKGKIKAEINQMYLSLSLALSLP